MSETDSQASIVDRLDAALERMVKAGEAPRAIHLTTADRDALDEHETRFWRNKLGSTAYFYPTSYADVPLISEHLIDKVEIPVRQCQPEPRVSAIYAASGRRFTLEP